MKSCCFFARFRKLGGPNEVGWSSRRSAARHDFSAELKRSLSKLGRIRRWPRTPRNAAEHEVLWGGGNAIVKYGPAEALRLCYCKAQHINKQLANQSQQATNTRLALPFHDPSPNNFGLPSALDILYKPEKRS